MSRHALRHRATPPLHETAWPLYVLLCAAQGRRASKFEFITWLTDKVRPHCQRRCAVEPMKADILASIAAEIALLLPDDGRRDLGAPYLLLCAAALAALPSPVAGGA